MQRLDTVVHLEPPPRLANKTQAQRAIAKYNNRVPRLLEKSLGTRKGLTSGGIPYAGLVKINMVNEC